MLTNNQQLAFKIMTNGDNLFLTGPAGTGKSFLIAEFKKWCTLNNKIIAITSTTGVSAILIGGVTLHSWAGIGIGNDSVGALTNKIFRNPKYRNRWLKTHVLIVDEVSMLDSKLFEKLDAIGKKVRGNLLPFGGMQIILAGDFCQLRPVKADHYCFESEIWNYCINHTVELTKILRQEDQKFQICLNEVRKGIVTDDTMDMLRDRLINPPASIDGIKPTRLFSHKLNVHEINMSELSKLKNNGSECKTFISKSKIKNKNPFKLTSQQVDNFVDILNKWVTAEGSLELAIGSQVMLICNLNLELKLANGSRGVIKKFSERGLPFVKFMNGIEQEIDMWDWVIDMKDDNVELIFSQIPLILADACTIHKAQGATLDLVQIDLGNTIFEFGQFYTALSRVRCLEGLFISSLDFEKVLVHPKVLEFYLKLPK